MGGIKIECPKCHNDRTMLDTRFGLPGYVEPCSQQDAEAGINPGCTIPVRLVLCPAATMSSYTMVWD